MTVTVVRHDLTDYCPRCGHPDQDPTGVTAPSGRRLGAASYTCSWCGCSWSSAGIEATRFA